MQTSQIISLLLFLSGWTISCFPTKPLNERSTELTWQAWLLIDESQNKQQDNSLRRRITPKSVFIAPTFSPENFPECSEGYQSDPMGRCIKIIMLNKELHLDFLLQQLNDKFGGMDDYEDEEGTTIGPLNINIPLNGEVQEETDVAIVVAPTNGVLRKDPGMNKPFDGAKVNVGEIAGILGLRQAAEVETTTITGTSTISLDSTTQESTTKNVESTTFNNGGYTSEFNALFFLDPKRQVEIKTENSNGAFTLFSTNSDSETTETDITKTTKKIKTGTTNGLLESLSDFSFLQMDQALPYSDSLISFNDNKREAIKSNKHETEIPQTESTSITFTTKAAATMLETNFSNIYHQVSPTESFPNSLSEVKVPQSTVASMVLTPRDDSHHDVFEATQSTLKSTESMFSVGFQKPNYETLFNNNKKIVSNLSGTTAQKNDNFVQDVTETPTTTTEIITTTGFEEEASTTVDLMSASETTTYLTNIPQITMVTENVLSVSEPSRVKFPTQTSQLVRFPSDEISSPPRQVSANVDHMLDASKRFEAIFNQYVSTRGADLTESHIHTFSNNQGIKAPSDEDMSQTLYQRYKTHRDNHRNRDKHSEWYHLPPKWTDTSQKPVVLRFSRKHGYIDTQQLGSNNFYREINPRIFGFPTKSRIHR